MKRAIIILVAAAAVLGVSLAQQPCPDLPPFDPNTVPFAYDPAIVRGDLLGYIQQRAGLVGTIEGTYCDNEGDAVTVRIESPAAGVALIQDPNNTAYQLVWQPQVAGVYPVWVYARDQPPAPIDPCEAVGTILWNVKPKNSKPKLNACGGIVR